jgi:uncharacterized coiled-coil protein SlyX
MGITVLTSTISVLFYDKVSNLNNFYKAGILGAGSVAIIYMILAGFFSMRTISGFISVYQLFPEDIQEKDEDKIRDKVAICAELNSLSNIIRQNLMNVSFHCIINSLVVMVIFFFLAGVSAFLVSETINAEKLNITVYPNQNDIDQLSLKISEQNNLYNEIGKVLKEQISKHEKSIFQMSSNIEKSIQGNDKYISSLKEQLLVQDKKISQLSRNLDELKKVIEINANNSEKKNKSSGRREPSERPEIPISITTIPFPQSWTRNATTPAN